MYERSAGFKILVTNPWAFACMPSNIMEFSFFKSQMGGRSEPTILAASQFPVHVHCFELK